MPKIKFLKNNQEIEIDQNEVIYNEDDLIIKKENYLEKSIIIFDFKQQKCFFKFDDYEVEIPVIQMDYQLLEDQHIFNYSLISEPDVKNTIIFQQKK